MLRSYIFAGKAAPDWAAPSKIIKLIKNSCQVGE